jgi:(2Fe-2S) ferredoxin
MSAVRSQTRCIGHDLKQMSIWYSEVDRFEALRIADDYIAPERVTCQLFTGKHRVGDKT